MDLAMQLAERLASDFEIGHFMTADESEWEGATKVEIAEAVQRALELMKCELRTMP